MVLATSAVAAWALALALHSVEPAAFDFIGIYASARLVAAGDPAAVADGQAVREVVSTIDPRRAGFLNNSNLPVTSLILAPLGALPFEAAYLVMLTAGTAALAGAGVLLARDTRAPAVAALVLLAPPSILALAHGQTTPFVLLALLGSLRMRGVGSGLVLATTVIRPQVFPLLALLALPDRGRLGGLAIGVAAAAAISLGMIGPAGVPRYADLVLSSARERGNNELGLAALAQRAIGSPAGADPALVNVGLSAAVLGVGAAAVIRARRRLEAAGVWSILAAPHALLHDLVFAYPAVVGRRPAAAALLGATGALALLLQLLGIPALDPWLLAVAFVTWRDRSAR